MTGRPAPDAVALRLVDLDPVVRSVAIEVSARCVAEGAMAVVLTGSQAGRDPQPESDIDVYAVGAGPTYRLETVSDRLVAVSWRELHQLRAAFHDPGAVGAFVPGWRRAIIVVDPNGIAADLQRAARDWDWPVIGDRRLDDWVAEEITGFAEEVHKLAGSQRRGDVMAAAVQRSVLALRLAPRMAVRLRILYETENGLWERVAECLGSDWTRAQRAALGLGSEPVAHSIDAAIELFAIAAANVWPVMDDRQRAVCAGALALAGRPVPT